MTVTAGDFFILRGTVKMNEERKYCVYCHTNKVNGKKYVGITCQTPERRWGKNGSAYKKSTYFYNAIKKYGWDNFNHEILFEGLTKDKAETREIELIAEWCLTNKRLGYNLAEGGRTNVPNMEARVHMSEGRKGKGLGLHPGNYKSYVGRKFGRLTVISEYTKKWQHYCVCTCDCGNEVTVAAYDLSSGHTNSCGCYAKERISQVHCTHGMTGTRIYRIWKNIKNRCYNKNVKGYLENIEVCTEWREDFSKFYNWSMTNEYQEDLKLLRRNSNKNYEPSNCYWGSRSRRILCVETNIEYNSVREASDSTGISRNSIEKNLVGYRKSAGSLSNKGKGFHFIYITDEPPEDEKK